MNITAKVLMEVQGSPAWPVIIDVRQPEELTGTLPAFSDALNIPMQELEQRYQEIPIDKDVVLVCRSGTRSLRAYFFLTQKGYTKVKNLQGGMIAVRRVSD